MTAKIFCIGANHKTADIVHREGFFLSSESLEIALPFVQRKHQLVELIVLSTCNRFELLGVSLEENAAHQRLDPVAMWLDLHEVARGRALLDRSALERMTYNLKGLDAVKHAFMVASSLDSLIPGETQITGQFKEAISLAQKAQTLGPVLGRLSQEAMTAAKKVRSQTSIGQRTVSISHAAVTLAKRMFHDLSDCRFLILGAGEMARMAAEHAKSYQPKQICIANRTTSRAYELAQHIGSSEGFGLEELEILISQADVVIAATASQTPVITTSILKEAMKQRDSSRPLFLVDISLPRNIESACRNFDDTYLFDIDDLKQVVDHHLSERQAAAVEASVIIDHATNVFGQWLATQDVTPVMEAWKLHVKGTLEREAGKTFAKDLFQGLDPKQRRAIADMVEAMTSRLSSDLAQGLRKANQEDAFTFATSMRRFFGLNITSKKDLPP